MIMPEFDGEGGGKQGVRQIAIAVPIVGEASGVESGQEIPHSG